MKLSTLAFSTLALVCLLGFSPGIQAATYTVTRNDDRNNPSCAVGDCSLREAISAASATSENDTINFAAGLTTITLTDEIQMQDITVSGTFDIVGPGANVLTIDGGSGENSIFFVSITHLSLSGVRLTKSGNAGFTAGVGVFVNGGSLDLNGVEITGITSQSGGIGLYLFNSTTHILNSTISSNNSLQSGCAGIYQNYGNLYLVNTTISGNTGVSAGGGICVQDGSAVIRNSTITNNTGGGGGGIYFSSTGTGSVIIGNTIVAGNTSSSNFRPEIFNDSSSPFNSVFSHGNNLVGDSAGDSTNTGNPVGYQQSDIRDVNPMLGALQYNGGQTRTNALLSGSPAIDAGDNAKAVDPFTNQPLTTDQRGYQRIVNGNVAGAVVDIGAFEFAAVPTAASVTVSGRVLAGKGRGVSRAFVYLTDSEGNTRTVLTNSFGYYRFEDVQVGETYVFSVFSKHHQFNPQVLTVNEEIESLNFTALE